MKTSFRRLFLLSPVLYVLFFALPSVAAERILRMDVVASVQADSSVVVTEEIKFTAEGRDIRRGLIRFIPVDYRIDGRILRTGFELLKAELDGRAVAYKIERNGSNIEIRLGDSDKYLTRGVHTYRLRYRTTRQVTFFKDHDELYWNVTGNEWEFPIDEATFRVELPGGASFTDHDAYTGSEGSTARYFQLDDDGLFRTTRPLQRNEGFTVAVGWPKGIVSPPSLSFMEKYWVHVLALSLMAMIAWYVFAWLRWGRDPARGVVFPLFAAPEGMDPSLARVILKRRYDEESLAADILQLAVKGFLTIQDKDGREIVLSKKSEAQNALEALSPTSGLRALWEELFARAPQLNLSAQDDETLRHIYGLLGGGRSAFSMTLSPYYRRNIPQLIFGVLLLLPGLLALLGAEYLRPDPTVLVGFGGIALLCFLVSSFILPAYTRLGRTRLDGIEGFTLYLKTAETHRLEALYPAVKDRIPEKTPELFERFLPYAVALDTADTWGDSFAALLKTSPPPDWYSGGSMSGLDRLARGVLIQNIRHSRSTWQKKEAARAKSKSSSSGLGGGGFSGGGRGGGGGKGW